MIRVSLDRITRIQPVVLLLALGPIAAMIVVKSTLVGTLAIIASGVAIIVTNLVDGAAIRRAALALCASIIAYSAFLPHLPGSRGQLHLLIVLAIAIAATWLWLSTHGSAIAFTRMPYSLLAGYSGVVLISLAYTPDRVWALWAMLKLFEAILVLGVLNVLVRTTEQLKRVIDVMLAGSALVLAFYWLDILRGTALESGAGRFVTTWLHPNGASMIAFTFTSIVAGRFFTATSQRKALIAGLLTCLGALTGLMIAGKTALIGGVLALILTIAITLARQAGYATLKKVLLVGLGLMFVTFYIVVKDVGIAAHLEAYSSEDTNVDPTSLTGRVAIWSVAIQRGLSSPIIGNGYMSTITTGLDGGEGWITGQAHNSFIQPFVDNGLIGFFLVLAIYIAAWHAITRQILTLRHMNQRWGLSVELLAGLTVLTVNSFTEVVFGGLFEIHTMLFIMIVFAIYQNARVSDT